MLLATKHQPKFNYRSLQVRVDIASIFYAIEHNYLKFAKLILEYDDCLSDAISNFSEELQGLFEVNYYYLTS